MKKFNITQKFGYNDCGIIITIRATDEDGNFINSASTTIKEDKRTPSEFGWKTALTEAVRGEEDMRGAIQAIKQCSRPEYIGSEDPHWM